MRRNASRMGPIEDGQSFPTLTIPFPDGAKCFEGHFGVYQWARGGTGALVAACALMALFVSAFVKGRDLFPDRMISIPEGSNTQQIANMLYGETGRMGQYTFAFEIASLLLLVAILGAVIMTKKKI